MKLNRKWILALALVMSMAMATTGTLAYLTDRDSDANVFTMGNVEIDLNEEFNQGAELIPGQNIEKKPTITNTGKTDAWVWMIWSIPTALDNAKQGTEQGSNENTIHWNPTGATTEGYVNATRVQKAFADGVLTANMFPAGTTNYVDYITANNMTWNVFNSISTGENMFQQDVEGVPYNHYVLLYNKALEPGETTLPSVYNVFLDAHVDIDPDGNMYRVEKGVAEDLNWNINTNGNPVIYVSAYAMQKDGFTTVKDAYNAYKVQWTTDDGVNNGLEFGAPATSVATNDEFKAALGADEETIVVSLTEDVTYDVAAWAANGMGGKSTEAVTIIGNGHTITFNQTNSDWNNIVTNNGAKLIISDAHITNAGKNDGPWNRHDLNFGCDVELQNVTSDKALAFKAGAKLTNVTISDANTSDTYAIWIQPNGQTVTLNNCTIDMLECTDGRGIKIDEQYVSSPAKVTLNVSNTTFATEEKSAILVKSAAGAQITLSNVNIAQVAADSANAVWVDEASAAYADLVVVNGGSKIVEP